MRHKGSYFVQYGRDIEKLDELGLNVQLSRQSWKKRVVPLLKTYAELHGEGEVPADFVVPSDTPWEKKVAGVRLGLIVALNSQLMSRN
ncbi:hypothetical protein PF002_g29206 [Phytophthora fragariae]|nr:hypothetical protein PF002_g29206 [Phytophthora fragariae]KAE9287570.1 hypothetical protein PF008_g26370 [Phytophthora fragariae]